MPTALLSEERLWGAPPRSDAEFLVSLRSRLSPQKTELWLRGRQVALVAGVAVVMLLALVSQAPAPQVAAVETDSEGLETVVDDFVETTAEVEELQAYLAPETVEEVAVGDQYVESDPSAEELLNVDVEEFNLVLAELEETEFF